MTNEQGELFAVKYPFRAEFLAGLIVQWRYGSSGRAVGKKEKEAVRELAENMNKLIEQLP